MRLPSPAKINLFLHITGRRDDGYHELQTVFQFLEFNDVLMFDLCDDGHIAVDGMQHQVHAEENLVYKAASLLRRVSGCQQGVRISIEKHIPIGAGLGGGSSNAACTMLALNELWRLGLSRLQLMALGEQLGADVPVFIHGQACWAEGIGMPGENLTLPERWYLLLVPAVSVSTAEMFAAPELTRQCAPITIADFLAGAGGNVFEAVVAARHPEVREALGWAARCADKDLRHSGFRSHGMSGTGCSVFMACANQNHATELAASLPDAWQGYVVQSRNCSPLLDALNAL